MNAQTSIARRAWLLAITLGMSCLAGGTAAAAGGDDDKPAFCTDTARAALKACRHEVQDDNWIAIGNCNNLASHTARKDCMQEAENALDESRSECREQFKARREICEVLGEAPYDPRIDPARFVDPTEIGKSIAPNPYFPLVAGRTWVYRSGDETITVVVTGKTREILGVRCAVVSDVVKENGQVIEDTVDWFCQDIQGNVWYFGELSKEFEDGQLRSLEGSWEAGVDSAKAGFIMLAQPVVGRLYRQEFSLGNAEDVAQVISLTGSATVPAARCANNCLVTQDSAPLSPGSVEHKYYAPGIGLILEVNPETGRRTELVQFTQ